MEGTGEMVEKWEVDEMMNDGDKNQDGMLDYEGVYVFTVKTRNIIKDSFRPLLKN